MTLSLRGGDPRAPRGPPRGSFSIVSDRKRGVVDWRTAAGALLLAVLGASAACLEGAESAASDGGAGDANDDAFDAGTQPVNDASGERVRG